MLVDEEGSIWFRQSWLDTAMRCNERGRLALVRPEWDERVNDAALIGTATHAAIEWSLNADTVTDIGEFAYAQAMALCEGADVKWTKWTLPGQLGSHASRCAQAWASEIRPSITLGGRTEVKFKVPLFTSNGRTVGITGTADYIQPDAVVIDWKTASKKYSQREKQRTAIQPTVYAAAAVHGGLDDGQVFTYPVTFRYGVMVRGDAKATTQLVDVLRVHAHELWLHDLLQGYVDLADGLGVTKRAWPRHEDHYLCNETWCPWWSMCKGARLAPSEDLWVGTNRG